MAFVVRLHLELVVLRLLLLLLLLMLISLLAITHHLSELRDYIRRDLVKEQTSGIDLSLAASIRGLRIRKRLGEITARWASLTGRVVIVHGKAGVDEVFVLCLRHRKSRLVLLLLGRRSQSLVELVEVVGNAVVALRGIGRGGLLERLHCVSGLLLLR